MEISLSRKKVLWLSCIEKKCCHNTQVTVNHVDLFQISSILELDPVDFCRAALAPTATDDTFLLGPNDQYFHLVLRKSDRLNQHGTPCIFLWQLDSGRAECGLNNIAPIVCQNYPAIFYENMIWANSHACSCRKWSVLDIDSNETAQNLALFAQQTQFFQTLIKNWNEDITLNQSYLSFESFCDYLLSKTQEDVR